MTLKDSHPSMPTDPIARQAQWDRAYHERANFVFSPHEEVVRFVARFIRKRIGLDEFRDITPDRQPTVLDLGCGIGRHVLYCHAMGLDAYGVDLSPAAIEVARTWAAREGVPKPAERLRQADARNLPWPDGFFHYAVSHGVLDSMPFAIARAAAADLARAMRPDGLFYCDLVSGDDSRHAREFSGEEVVTAAHERDTVQLYFNLQAIHALFDGLFEVVECILVRREDVTRGGYSSRYHLTLKRHA